MKYLKFFYWKEINFCLKCIKDSQGLHIVEHLQRTKREYKNLKTQEIHQIFIKMNYSMIYKFFDKKTSGSGIKNQNISNKELA